MYAISKLVESRNRDESHFIMNLGMLAFLQMTLALIYRDETNQATTREVLPVSLVRGSDGVLLLKAFCLKRLAYRTFRYDRIVSAVSANSYSRVEDYPMLGFVLQVIKYAAEFGITLDISEVQTSWVDSTKGDAHVGFYSKGKHYNAIGYGYNVDLGNVEYPEEDIRITL